MPERIKIPFTNEHFAAYCRSMLGHPYWYGTCGYKATSGLLTRKTAQYPSHYADSRKSRYRQDIAAKEVVCDCIGGCKGYAWSGGGGAMLEAYGSDQSISSVYGSHGCPDRGANGMFDWAKSKGAAWGTIDTLPEIVGLALKKDGHAGYYVGNGKVVEWRGFAYGCVETNVSERGWQYWYQLPFIDYGMADLSGDGSAVGLPAVTEYVLGTRTLRKGSKGSDVRTLQELLLQLDFKLPKYGADGSYGAETAKAVTSFQQSAAIKADGIYGSESHAALMDAVSENDHIGDADTSETDRETTEDAATDLTPRKVTIVCDSGTVNIRKGNDTRYSRITAVKAGTTLAWIATAQNGWHAVAVNGQVGWVSGAFAQVA